MRRNADPGTSHAAALQHAITRLSTRRRQVLTLVCQYPGRTHGELSRLMYAAHPELPFAACAESPHKRLPELESMTFVWRGPARRCRDSGYLAATWYPAKLEAGPGEEC